MLNETNTPQTNAFEVYRDGQLDKSYKPKVIGKKLKSIVIAITAYFAALGYNLAAVTVKGLISAYSEVRRNIAMDLIDHRYNTSIRAQYHSGKRSQAILATKRSIGLI